MTEASEPELEYVKTQQLWLYKERKKEKEKRRVVTGENGETSRRLEPLRNFNAV